MIYIETNKLIEANVLTTKQPRLIMLISAVKRKNAPLNEPSGVSKYDTNP